MVSLKSYGNKIISDIWFYESYDPHVKHIVGKDASR